jgi:hypothetical protein
METRQHSPDGTQLHGKTEFAMATPKTAEEIFPYPYNVVGSAMQKETPFIFPTRISRTSERPTSDGEPFI